MQNPFANHRYCSVDLNPYGTQLVEEDFRKVRTSPVDEKEKIVLSTGQQSIQLDKETLDETVLRNILYCYEFLDTNDRDFVNSAEAEVYIRQIREENPQLFQLLYDVLHVVSDFDSNDSNIAKNMFISRLKNHIRNLKPDDTSSVYSLRTPANAISEYFKNQHTPRPQGFTSETFLNRLNTEDFPSRYRQESRESVFQFDQHDYNNVNDQESVFNPNPLDQHVDDHQNFENVQPNQLPDYHDNVNVFQSVKEYEHVLNTTSNVNEYIVFNYNYEFDWERSLRELT